MPIISAAWHSTLNEPGPVPHLHLHSVFNDKPYLFLPPYNFPNLQGQSLTPLGIPKSSSMLESSSPFRNALAAIPSGISTFARSYDFRSFNFSDCGFGLVVIQSCQCCLWYQLWWIASLFLLIAVLRLVVVINVARVLAGARIRESWDKGSRQQRGESDGGSESEADGGIDSCRQVYREEGQMSGQDPPTDCCHKHHCPLQNDHHIPQLLESKYISKVQEQVDCNNHDYHQNQQLSHILYLETANPMLLPSQSPFSTFLYQEFETKALHTASNLSLEPIFWPARSVSAAAAAERLQPVQPPWPASRVGLHKSTLAIQDDSFDTETNSYKIEPGSVETERDHSRSESSSTKCCSSINHFSFLNWPRVKLRDQRRKYQDRQRETRRWVEKQSMQLEQTQLQTKFQGPAALLGPLHSQNQELAREDMWGDQMRLDRKERGKKKTERRKWRLGYLAWLGEWVREGMGQWQGPLRYRNPPEHWWSLKGEEWLKSKQEEKQHELWRPKNRGIDLHCRTGSTSTSDTDSIIIPDAYFAEACAAFGADADAAISINGYAHSRNNANENGSWDGSTTTVNVDSVPLLDFSITSPSTSPTQTSVRSFASEKVKNAVIVEHNRDLDFDFDFNLNEQEYNMIDSGNDSGNHCHSQMGYNDDGRKAMESCDSRYRSLTSEIELYPKEVTGGWRLTDDALMRLMEKGKGPIIGQVVDKEMEGDGVGTGKFADSSIGSADYDYYYGSACFCGSDWCDGS